MSFAVNVHGLGLRRKRVAALPPSHSASVRVVVGDALGTFVRQLGTASPWRVMIVSPWIGGWGGRGGAPEAFLRDAERRSYAVVVVTRPPTTAGHRSALDRISGLPRATVILNPRLHAKIYLAEEQHGAGFAVIGSGNATSSSTGLDEASLLIRPIGRSSLVRHLALRTIPQLSGASRHRFDRNPFHRRSP
jgi:hypothetical protein